VLELIKRLVNYILGNTTKQDSSTVLPVIVDLEKSVPVTTSPIKEVYMISLNEILQNKAKLEELPQNVQDNIQILLVRINKIRNAYGKPMKVNDGIRIPGKTNYGAKSSTHYLGAAIDIDDDIEGTLWKWVLENRMLLKEIGLWLEHPCYTHYIDPKTGQERSWIHFQIIPPGSGKRFYIPSSAPNPNPSFWDGKYESSLDSKEQPK